MSNATVEPVELLPEPAPRQARRRRWAGLLAATFCMAHIATAIILFGWYYWIVPKWKFELDNFGYDLSTQAKYLIGVSDCVVNYWYLMMFALPIAVTIDFVATRWMARQIGLRYASLVGLSVVFLMLANLAIGQYFLIDAKDQMLKLITIQGRSPNAQPLGE